MEDINNLLTSVLCGGGFQNRFACSSYCAGGPSIEAAGSWKAVWAFALEEVQGLAKGR